MQLNLLDHITPIGVTDFRGQHQLFGIKDSDRLGHIYSLGKTGAGKSTLLLNMAIHDINEGNGIGVIDPHGDLATVLLNYIPTHRWSDVIYFNPSDTTCIIPFNPLSTITPEQHHLAVAGLIGTFKRIWGESWGPRLEHILRYSLFLLLAAGHGSLLNIQPLLTDKDFRHNLLRVITNPSLLSFWYGEFERYSPFLRAEVVASILNKIGLFHISQPLYCTLAERPATWSILDVMNSRKILIANLAKGTLGEDASSILGSLLIHAFQLAALGRAAQARTNRVPFYLYVDEAHSFLTLSMVDILSEARKFGLSLFLTHQYLEQIPEKLRAAIFGNVGTLVAFGMGARDAVEFAREFSHGIAAADLVQLPRYAMYIKLLIDGVPSPVFSALARPLAQEHCSEALQVIEFSRRRYGVLAAEETLSHATTLTKLTRKPLSNQPSLF